VSESVSLKSSVPEGPLLTKPKVMPDDYFLDGKIFPEQSNECLWA